MIQIKPKRFLLIVCILLLIIKNSFAQANIKDSSIDMSIVSVHYCAQLPGGDLATRYGWNSNLGVGYMYKTHLNYLFGFQASYLFGGAPIENGIMNNIITPEGNILGSNGQFANVALYERGINVMINFGRIYHLLGPNPNSGLFIMGGLGFLQHQIFISDISKNVPEIDGEYSKGYDRLTNGFAVSQTFGYIHFGNKHLINFFIDLEFTEGFTKNRRPLNFDTMQKDDKNRFDVLYGLTFGWSLPLYQRVPNKFYYY